MSSDPITVIGGGLAGTEAAYQLARAGVENIHLYEMRPTKPTGAHHTDRLAELVCSNSLGSYDSANASALLKEEMRLFGSLIIEQAWRNKVPAGGALAVDRLGFAQGVTEAIESCGQITLHREELEEIPRQGIVIVATGPLTSDSLAASIKKLSGQDSLHFFDAAAPILSRDSLNFDIVYEKSRYDKGEGVYLNCPMNKEQYLAFYEALMQAEKVSLKDFEKDTAYFESCLPVEVIASRGVDTLRFGPMKPVGLEDPRTGKRPYAVVQLRQDNAASSLYNIVGFQTNLKWGEQKRVFSLIPGMENVEFLRLGVMHRNTYLNSPLVLNRNLAFKNDPRVFCAGQLTGVEGYSESTAMGILAGLNAARLSRGEALLELPATTMIGALVQYITNADPRHFQPINSNWGIIQNEEFAGAKKMDKKEKRCLMASAALAVTKAIVEKSVSSVFKVY